MRKPRRWPILLKGSGDYTGVLSLCRVYHRDKKDETLDRAKRGKLDIVLTTHDTARTHVVGDPS